MAIITGIIQQKRNQKRYSIFVDDVFFVGTSDYIIVKYKLKKGMEVSTSFLKQVCFEDSLEDAKAYVLRYHLGKPRAGIRQKLLEKGYDKEVIETVLEFLERQQFLDDLKFAQSFKETALQSKQFGKQKIISQLWQKGVAVTEIQQIAESISFEEELQAAQTLLAKKKENVRKKSKNLLDWKKRATVLLRSRGFSNGVITHILSNKIMVDEMMSDETKEL